MCWNCVIGCRCLNWREKLFNVTTRAQQFGVAVTTTRWPLQRQPHLNYKEETWCGQSSHMESSSPSPSSSGQGDPPSHGQSTSKSKSSSSPSGQQNKICGVCGDRAKSYHFGGISCDSCKAFFRRSVQNDAHKNFQCSYDYDCEINITSRKCCQHCRFQKCLRIGMEMSWVMTEEERVQILRQRMERRANRQQERQRELMSSAAGKRSTTEKEDTSLSEEDTEIIADIVQRYSHSFQQVPYAPELLATNDNRSIVDIVGMLSTTIRRITHFAGHLDVFSRLSQSDQETLLRSGMVELCLIRAAYAYDEENRCWPNTKIFIYHDCPYLRVEDLQRIVSPDLHEMHMRFNSSIREMNLDENAMMLFLMVTLFTPDRPGLEAEDQVTTIQENYLRILKQYITWKYSPEVSSKLYPKILLKLPDLRQLNDAHTESQLRLMEEDVHEIQKHVVGSIVGSKERHFGNGQEPGPSRKSVGPSTTTATSPKRMRTDHPTTDKHSDSMPSVSHQSSQPHSVESLSQAQSSSTRQRSSSESSSSS